MTTNPQSTRRFEEAVESFFRIMGYETHPNIALHTRPVHIHAKIHHPHGTQRILIGCKHTEEGPIGLKEVEKFCSSVALARDKSQVDRGLLVSGSNFSEEATAWVARNCTFVELKTYKQVIHKSIRFNKLMKKFHSAL